MHSSFDGPLSSSSESEEESDKLPSPLASFNFSLLLSFGKPFIATSTALEPFNSEATAPDASGAAEEVTGVPESCSFFLIKSRADDDPGPEVLRVVASRPPVLTAGALKVVGVVPFSIMMLVFGTDFK